MRGYGMTSRPEGVEAIMSDMSRRYSLTSRELATARSALEVLQHPVVIKVVQTRNPLSGQFRKFVVDLASTSGKLEPVFLTYAEDGPPVIELQSNLRYLALPGGGELYPFLNTLVLSSQGELLLKARSLSALEGFITPTQVKVMISPTCPHCPKVVSLVNQLALATSYLTVSIIDVTLFSEYAKSHGIGAVPTVVINDMDQLAGEVGEELLVDRLVDRTASAFHPETFKKIVKEGDAIKLAAMMVMDRRLYAGALELLADPEWSVRMGMMVVLEEVAERSSNLVQQAFPYLLQLLDHEVANLRGDAAYLLGLIGDASVLSRLEVVIGDENAEVAGAAQEAIQQIRDRRA